MFFYYLIVHQGYEIVPSHDLHGEEPAGAVIIRNLARHLFEGGVFWSRRRQNPVFKRGLETERLAYFVAKLGFGNLGS